MRLKHLITTTALLMALAVPSSADHKVPYPDPSVIKVPPPEYDPRLRGYPKAKVIYILHRDMYHICSDDGTNPKIGPKVLACAKPKKGLIYLPKGMTIALRNAVLRHERGHMWGWTHANTTGGTEGLHQDDLEHDHEGDH